MAPWLRLRLLCLPLAALAAGVPSPGLAAGQGRSDPVPGIALNEDFSHFFFTRSPDEMTEAGVDALIDAYAGTQVREVLFCVNCMRANVASRCRQAIWEGYDPDAGDDQPFFAGVAPDKRASLRHWVHNALLLHRRGIDPYARWIARSRERGLSPWLSIRMNDVHNADQPENPMHDRFWREHPEYRRVPWRAEAWVDRALDYGRPEVREYQMAFIREQVERYDVDGVELDWMRFGYHLRPGSEEEGAAILTAFTAEVRRLLDARAKQLGHPVRLGARVPTRPETALGLGLDAVAWARQGLVDFLVVTPFHHTIEFDMPIELWKQLLDGTRTTLAAGLDTPLQPYLGVPSQFNTVETMRGAACALLGRGADRIYLFNVMDDKGYRPLLREAGALESMAGKPRRHVVTFSDTWAPGEPRPSALPRPCARGRSAEFRVPVGPAPQPGQPVQVRLGLLPADPAPGGEIEVRVNGDTCAFAGALSPAGSRPGPTHAYDVPAGALHRGNNVVHVGSRASAERQIVWVEIAVGAAEGRPAGAAAGQD